MTNKRPTLYCANDPCENEATHIVERSKTPLCYTCAEAYKWGQSNPDGTVIDLRLFVIEEEENAK